ncbi:hypothetical protein OH76DRAFT_1409684 [Lentinus brumalis]|uniref:Uncharacterized protein n=1 Tax=Lentinus brumalis TaxID=2498619 RepID=A0A371CUC5_9APHY|nr:hypothetical protein OH76DRAFT_1409684 [Polyporus brumalis]
MRVLQGPPRILRVALRAQWQPVMDDGVNAATEATMRTHTRDVVDCTKRQLKHTCSTESSRDLAGGDQNVDNKTARNMRRTSKPSRAVPPTRKSTSLSVRMKEQYEREVKYMVGNR